MSDSIKTAVTITPEEKPTQSSSDNHNHLDLHLVRRGDAAAAAAISDEDNNNTDANTSNTATIPGYNAHRMRARALLTAEEEKRLLRRIDWRLMPLCSLMFLLKNVDANSVHTYIQIHSFIYIDGCPGRKRKDHEQRIGNKYPHAVEYDG